MRFLVDECSGPKLAAWLADEGHEVFSVYDQARGSDDGYLILKAFTEGWILITNDKDFGEKIYRQRHPHRGVVFLRLRDEAAASKIRVMKTLLAEYSNRLVDQFVVATESRVRFGRTR
jgi:predicted nuclease of predicted toxin-antitoxin system